MDNMIPESVRNAGYIYYEEPGIVLLKGDCLEILPLFEPKSFDIVLTDPPYGMNFQSNMRLVKHDKIANDDKLPIDTIIKLIKLSSHATFIFCRWNNLIELPVPKSFIVWVKNNGSMGDLNHEYGRQWEGCAFYANSEHKFITRPRDIIHCNGTGNELHPTQKPVELIKKIISHNEGDTIIDPFGGSCTTAVAAKQLGRQCVVIELEEKYLDKGIERLKQEQLF